MKYILMMRTLPRRKGMRNEFKVLMAMYQNGLVDLTTNRVYTLEVKELKKFIDLSLGTLYSIVRWLQESKVIIEIDRDIFINPTYCLAPTEAESAWIESQVTSTESTERQDQHARALLQFQKERFELINYQTEQI